MVLLIGDIVKEIKIFLNFLVSICGRVFVLLKIKYFLIFSFLFNSGIFNFSFFVCQVGFSVSQSGRIGMGCFLFSVGSYDLVWFMYLFLVIVW